MYFLQHKVFTAPDGSQQPVWIYMDTGLVGSDGVARTSSPPYPGFSQRGQVLCARYDEIESPVNISVNTAGYVDQESATVAVAASYGVGVMLGSSFPPAVLIPYATMVALQIWNYRVLAAPPLEEVVNLELQEGVRDYTVEVAFPQPAGAEPVINSITLDAAGEEVRVTLGGFHFGGAVEVLFEMAEQRVRVPSDAFISLSDTELAVAVPHGFILGITDVSVVDMLQGSSNIARLTPPGGLGFSGLSTDLAVFDQLVSDETPPGSIVLTSDSGTSMLVRDVLATGDNVRVYVAAIDASSGDGHGAIFVVDTLTAKQVDEIPLYMNPWRLATDPDNKFLYVAGGTRHVSVVNIDPESNDFHEVVDVIELTSDRMPTDGIAVSPDGRRLYVSTYEHKRVDGYVVVINIDPDDPESASRPVIADVHLAMQDRTWHPAEIIPVDATRLLVTPRPYLTVSQPYVFTFTLPDEFSTDYEIGLIHAALPQVGPSDGSLDPNIIARAIENPRGVAVTSSLEYAFVTDFGQPLPEGYYRVQRSAKVGVIRDPFSIDGPADFIGSTTGIQWGFADEIVLSPDDSRLFVGYNGVHEILVMDAEEMITVSESMTPQQRIDTPIDQASESVHIAPLVLGVAPRGISLQPLAGEAPTVEVSGNEDQLFFHDDNEFTLTVANTADGSTTDRSVMVRIEVAGEATRFLVDDLGFPLGPIYQREVAPGEEYAFRVQSADLLSSIRSELHDYLDTARFHVSAWETTGSPTPGSLLLGESFYVYRFLDAADSIHSDGTITMIAALDDGTGESTVRRVRPLGISSDTTVAPTLEIEDTTHFQFVETPNKQFVFDPDAEGDLSSLLVVKRPDTGREIGTLEIEGRGVGKTRINVNQQGLIDVLNSIAEDTSFATLVSANEINPLLLTETERRMCGNSTDIAIQVMQQMRVLIQGFAQGVEIVDEPATPIADNTILIEWKTLVAPDAHGWWGFGDSAPGGGIDSRTRLETIYNRRSDLNQTQREFLLADALNATTFSRVDVYVDNHMEYMMGDTGGTFTPSHPLSMSSEQLVNALATTAIHEAGHTLGLVHTAQSRPDDLIGEEQFINLVPGTAQSSFTLTFDGQTTELIPSGASAADIQDALRNLSNLDASVVNVTDAATPEAFRVEFVGHFSGLDVPDLSAPPSLRVEVATLQPGTPTNNEIQDINLADGYPTDRFTLTFQGHTTNEIRRDASREVVATELEALPSIGTGNVNVIQDVHGRYYSIEFTGTLGHTDAPLLEALGGPDVAIIAQPEFNGESVVMYPHEIDINGIQGRTDIMLQGTLDVLGDERFPQ